MKKNYKKIILIVILVFALLWFIPVKRMSHYEEMKSKYGEGIMIPTSVPGSKESKDMLKNIFGVTIYYI